MGQSYILKMHILVNLFGESTQAVELAESTTVGQLKNLISNEQSISEENLILSTEGTQMIDDYLISVYNAEIIAVESEVLGEGNEVRGRRKFIRLPRESHTSMLMLR